MHAEMAQYYDRIYASKDYAGEVGRLLSCVDRHRRSTGKRLLDVACGTGRHLEFLAEAFDADGLDLSSQLLEAARVRNPGHTLYCADMRTFDLGSRYDVITCLFGSIGYMTSLADLNEAVGNMARHLAVGGVLIIEPWLTPEAWKPGTVHGLLIDEPKLKIARISTSLAEGSLSVFDLHHLVGTPEGTFHFVEHHEMGLYTTEQMMVALDACGLQASYEPDGLAGRGLCIGVKGNESNGT